MIACFVKGSMSYDLEKEFAIQDHEGLREFFTITANLFETIELQEDFISIHWNQAVVKTTPHR